MSVNYAIGPSQYHFNLYYAKSSSRKNCGQATDVCQQRNVLLTVKKYVEKFFSYLRHKPSQ